MKYGRAFSLRPALSQKFTRFGFVDSSSSDLEHMHSDKDGRVDDVKDIDVELIALIDRARPLCGYKVFFK